MQTRFGSPGDLVSPRALLAAALLCTLLPGSRSEELDNGGFERGLTGWRPFWTRAPQAGEVALDGAAPHAGGACARIDHRGNGDWSFEPNRRFDAQAGDRVELECWVKTLAPGNLVLCVSTWDQAGKALDWSYGEAKPGPSGDWQRVVTRFLVPPGVVQFQPRLIGHGPGAFAVDEVVLRRLGNVAGSRQAGLPATLSLSNAWLSLEFSASDGTLAVRDRRVGRTWRQAPLSQDVQVLDAALETNAVRLKLLSYSLGLEFAARIRLEPTSPEILYTLTGEGAQSRALQYPPPFATAPGDSLVVPMNEGISYPVEDPEIDTFRLIAYGGHGICMAFWGVTDGTAGQMAIIESPDDAAIHLQRQDSRLVVAPEWDPQLGRFGPERRLRWVFQEAGGHVAMAKRYRAYAREKGLLKTLAEKRRTNPNVDSLVGAVNIWCWDRNAVSLVKEIQAAGIERILWSNAQSPENLRALNELGVLTSRYDIYQDVMAPTNFSRLRWIHPDWTTAAWPRDLIATASGDWLKGWGVETKDGGMVSCGVLCDLRAPAYARERIPAELATHPYRCRFIDTTTAAPWNECYDPAHPMTRSQSRHAKMELLRYVSEDNRLVTGCETGHDAAVPFLHYFEGMLSLGPYRVPDAGRRMNVIWTNVPDRVARFQLGHRYRLPLWELVYHDCVVAQWYWGDYNNKLPALWTRRDLFNVLYGVPPMFMFDRNLWEKERTRFARSYANTCPYVRQVGYQEMTNHRFLTPDRSVQQTTFANGVAITVNFGDQPFRLPSGATLAPLSFEARP